MIVLFVLMLASEANPHVSLIREYQDPVDIYMTWPGDMDYGADDRLYVLDMELHKVLVWDGNGAFIKAFSRKGKGPGEIENPTNIAVAGSKLYVAQARRVSVFDTDGNFQRVFNLKQWPRAIMPVSEGRIFYSTSAYSYKQSDTTIAFMLEEPSGKEARTIKSFLDRTLIVGKAGSGRMKLRAFAPDVELQRGPNGAVYFGFSDNRKIYRVNAGGQIADELEIPFPTSHPTDEEIAAFKSMSVPTANGERMKFDKLPGIEFDFEHPKAHYTQFIVTPSKIVFIMTPIGSTGAGLGFSHGTYYVYDMKSGTITDRGQFRFPEDSRLLTKSGRLLGVLVIDDEYKIRELSLKGM